MVPAGTHSGTLPVNVSPQVVFFKMVWLNTSLKILFFIRCKNPLLFSTYDENLNINEIKSSNCPPKTMASLSKVDFLEQIFRHQALIHKICRMYRDSKEDREDLFQEIIYQLWKSYPQFQGRAKLSTWMYKIGLNTVMATFRKHKLQQFPLEDYHGETLPEITSENESGEKLHYAIRQLNEADRAFITLYFEDLSYQEMGEILGISENNVGVRLSRIKEKIRKSLNRSSWT